MKKPERPFKNIQEFRKHMLRFNFGLFFKKNLKLFPCVECGGQGRIYDPNDAPDIIEGNKMRNRIKCPICEGERTMSPKSFRFEYAVWIQEWKDKMVKYKKFQLILKSAKKKIIAAGLTRAEKKAIGL